MGAATFLYYSPQTARECSWDNAPTGVVSFVNSSSAPNHDTVVGCTKSHRGIAGGCAATFENPYWHGVSGVCPATRIADW
eukprot:9034487-Pyramimonas_sp.AAC.1